MRNFRKTLRRLGKDQAGASAILFATSLSMLMGAAAVSVDVASIYLAKRELQGVADAAALAAARHTSDTEAQGAANGVIGAYGISDVLMSSLQSGKYALDGGVAIEDRFSPGGGDPDAVRVELERNLPLFFANFFGHANTKVVARATAQRADMAAYSLGTGLVRLSGGIPNQLLSALAGTELNLSVMDVQGLATARLDLLHYADALKIETGHDDVTYGELFKQSITLDQAIAAMARASDDSATATVLRDIASRVGGDHVRLADIVDLGPLGGIDYNSGTSAIEVDAYSLLRALLEISHGKHYDVAFDLSAAGLAKASARLVGGSGWERSPWLTVTSAKDHVLRSAQSRLLLDVETNTGSLLLPRLKLPLYVELAEAEARLTDIVCKGDPAHHGVTIAVTPSIGSVAIAGIDAARMADLDEAMPLSQATLFASPLVKVQGKSEVELGGLTARRVHFSMPEIKARTVKTVSTNDLTQAIAASLIEDVDLKVSALGFGVNAGALTTLVGTTLRTVGPAIDGLLFQITEAAGVKLGAADVRVDKARCGIPTLVA